MVVKEQPAKEVIKELLKMHCSSKAVDTLVKRFEEEVTEQARKDTAREIIGRIENLNSINYAYGAEYKQAVLHDLKSKYIGEE